MFVAINEDLTEIRNKKVTSISLNRLQENEPIQREIVQAGESYNFGRITQRSSHELQRHSTARSPIEKSIGQFF